MSGKMLRSAAMKLLMMPVPQPERVILRRKE
jgi:hypothetical protein